MMGIGIGVFHIVATLWLIWIALMMKVENAPSFMLFKFIPAVFAMVEALLALNQFGFIVHGVG